VAVGGTAYPAKFNQQSAVSAVLPLGTKLGLKPGEFDFVCPFVEHGETLMPCDAERIPGHPWRVVGEGNIGIDGVAYKVRRVAVGAAGWRLWLESRQLEDA